MIGLLTTGPGATIDLSSVASVAALIALPSVGLLLVVRVPGNRIGWLMLVSMLILELETGMPHLAAGAIGASAGAAWSTWATEVLFLPAVLPLIVFLPLLFPTGRLPSLTWQPVADLAFIVLVWGTGNVIFQDPFPVSGPLADVLGSVFSAVGVFGLMLLLAEASLLVRYRSAAGPARQVIRWPVAAAAVMGLAGAVGLLTFGIPWGSDVSYAAFIVMFVAGAFLVGAIALAVTRRGPAASDVSALHSRSLPAGRLIAALGSSLVAVVLITISLVTIRPGGPNDPLTAVATAVAALAALVVGTWLVVRFPGERIGWLLWASGLAGALFGGATGVADHGLNVAPGSVPGAIWFAWLSQWSLLPFLWLLGGLVPLLYPDGRLAAPRWRSVALIGTLMAILLSVLVMLIPFPSGLFPVDNPLAAGDLAGNVVGLIGSSDFMLYLVILAAVSSLVVRYRQAAGTERAQLRWFAATAAITGPAFVIGVIAGGSSNTVTPVSQAAFTVADVGLVLLPVAIGIAVLRYRLYEIDRLISRTIAYALLTVILAGVFVAVVLALQALVSPLIPANQLAVAASTLLVFVLFQPLRRRVQGIVDRRFNRARYDAERTVAAFADRLRHEVDLAAIEEDLLATTRAALEPASVALWLPEAPFGGRA